MRKYTILSLATSALIFGSVVSASAQQAVIVPQAPTAAVVTPVVPAEPVGEKRAIQVESRIDKQEQAVDVKEQTGKITPKQAAKDKKHLANQENKLKKDEIKHNGKITKHEQENLNKGLDKTKKLEDKQVIHNNLKKGTVVTPVPVTDAPVVR